jgi:hypothetical protein
MRIAEFNSIRAMVEIPLEEARTIFCMSDGDPNYHYSPTQQQFFSLMKQYVDLIDEHRKKVSRERLKLGDPNYRREIIDKRG